MRELLISSYVVSAIFSIILIFVVNILPKKKAAIHVLIISAILVILKIFGIVGIVLVEIFTWIKVIVSIQSFIFIIIWGLVFTVVTVYMKKNN